MQSAFYAVKTFDFFLVSTYQSTERKELYLTKKITRINIHTENKYTILEHYKADQGFKLLTVTVEHDSKSQE